MAVGAKTGDMHRLVLGQALKLTAIGVGFGLLLSLGLAQVMASALFGIISVDAGTFALFAAVLTGAGVLAAYLPARRAVAIDPVVALRVE
jgi:putative ABC transport system permease protein